jgi:phospholipase C
MSRSFLKSCTALAAAVAMTAQPVIVTSVSAQVAPSYVTAQPNPTPDVVPYFNDPATGPQLSVAQTVALLRAKVKYVFVIFNENRSFDHQYGTFPGANGLYSDGKNPRSAANTPGFTQTYTDANNATVNVQPFLIGPAQNANVIDSVDHSHTGLAKKLDVVGGTAKMDKFASDEYTRFASKGGASNIALGKQFARLVMSHIDCDTIPFFWYYASRFTIFDNMFATEDTPSTPNAVAMIAGQAGETQWVKHGSAGTAYTVGSHSGTTQGPPLVNDPQPFYGSQFDTTPAASKQPAGAKESYADTNIASNLTFASLPLTFQGRNVTAAMAQDLNPGFDLPDIQQDIPFIQAKNRTPVNWRWYQEGYDLEPSDTTSTASHNSYVSHHQGPQYFGYIANNPALNGNLRGLNDFFTDIGNNKLPTGGVFYIRGGFTNIIGQVPYTNPGMPSAEVSAVIAAKSGDDNHPGYTDAYLSESMAARVINAVAANPAIWNQSAIVITYDESDGFYDHVPPRILSYGPDGLPLSRGIRIPMIVISPFSRVHTVSHVEGDHNAVIQTINAIFNLPPLASLPDEAQALAAGAQPAFNGPNGFVNAYLGPRDINSPITGDLLSAFDPKRLLGLSPILPGSYATIPTSVVNSFPHYGGNGCAAIGITTEDRQQGLVNVIPTGFNPLASTYPAAN